MLILYNIFSIEIIQMIPTNKPIQIIYTPGMFGNCLRWLLDRFSSNSAFKKINSPWDKNDRAHGFASKDFLEKFKRAHQMNNRFDSPDPLADKIVINFPLEDLLFAMRCDFYRNPGMEIESARYAHITKKADSNFVRKTFKTIDSNKQVAKELTKIELHNIQKHAWWNTIKKYIEDKSYYQFPVDSLWNEEKLKNQLQLISKNFNLQLQLDQKVIENVVNKIKNMNVVITKDRVKNILNAIKENRNIDCSELDILEQASVETILEQQHDSIIFPYGTTWFTNTAEINNFINTYPSYLKHMNPRLPWYNGLKNPYYLKDKID